MKVKNTNGNNGLDIYDAVRMRVERCSGLLGRVLWLGRVSATHCTARYSKEQIKHAGTIQK
jgi:hypothetical protein